MVAQERWSLTGSFTNSNLTEGGTNRDFGSVKERGGLCGSGRFHCIISESDPRSCEATKAVTKKAQKKF